VTAIENKSQLIFGTMSQLDAAQIISGGRKNGFLLAHNGYVYQKNRTKNDKIYWRCEDSSCNVYLQTSVFEVKLGARVPLLNDPSQAHSHRTNDDLIDRQTALQTRP
jgi:hypothetical protein